MAMKGSMWEFMVYGTVLIVVAIFSWMLLTPFFNGFALTMGETGNFTNAATNTSYHNLIDYNNNMWNMWPIVAVLVVFIFFFVVSHDDEKVKYTGGFT